MLWAGLVLYGSVLLCTVGFGEVTLGRIGWVLRAAERWGLARYGPLMLGRAWYGKVTFMALWGHGKKNKYGATSTKVDGRSFPSKLEASVYLLLKALERQNKIKILGFQKQVVLTDPKNGNKIIYKADFFCTDLEDYTDFFAEAKGFEDAKWIQKKRAWRHSGPCQLRIYKGTYKTPFLHEVIDPGKAALVNL